MAANESLFAGMGLTILILLSIFSLTTTSLSTSGGTKLSFRNINTTIDECSLKVCEDLQLPSYPNIGIFLSLDPDWNFRPKDQNLFADAITSYVSSFGYPSNVHCYFHRDATYNLQIDWAAFLRGESGSVSIGSGYFCIGFVFEALFEFEDVNLNGIYDPTEDNLLSQQNLVLSKWEKAEIISNGLTYSISTKTKDGLVSLRWSFASIVQKEKGSDFVLTPNATRLEIEIHDYPFTKGKASVIGLRGYIATDGATSDIEEKRDSQLIIGEESNKGYFSWSDIATGTFENAEGNKVEKRSRVLYNFAATDDVPRVIDLGLVKAILGTTAEIKDIHFYFSDYNQPSHVKWHFSVGYGDPPDRHFWGDFVVAMVIFVALAIPAIAVFFFTIKRMNQPPPEEEAPIVPQNLIRSTPRHSYRSSMRSSS